MQIPDKNFNNHKDSLDEEYPDEEDFNEVSEVLENEDEA